MQSDEVIINLYNIGTRLYKEGKFELANHYFARCYAITKVENESFFALATYGLALIHFEISRYETAALHFEDAINNFEKLPSKENLNRIVLPSLFNKGILYYYKGLSLYNLIRQGQKDRDLDRQLNGLRGTVYQLATNLLFYL